MEHPLVVCAQCGRTQLPDGSWREPIKREEGDTQLLSREGICPSCERAVSEEQGAGSHQAAEPFALGVLVQLLGGLGTAGDESRNVSRKQ